MPKNDDHSQPLLDFTPTSITVCHYRLLELGYPPLIVTAPATIDRITAALGALTDAAHTHAECTQELSDSMALIVEGEGQRTTIVAQFYGCGMVRSDSTVRFGAKSLRWITELPQAD